MRWCLVFGVWCLVLFAAPVFADSKDESLRPLDGASESAGAADTPAGEEFAADPALEKKYRTELEKRLAVERESYEGSLTSLWLANMAVWGCLFGFIIFQAVSARKRAAELERLKQQREAQAP
ncbi:MAG: hypothetical protein K8I27_12575 [Planctomycetes bacterium]|nr:hypothetical protein [Planctomycetota bacterium]